ncbi:FG-GAP-like repeat-containing protein [Allorhodopirellula solitaria]|uniref:ASPIC and UnbV n=1 Tax=Allorhodopirellula solitaria TaxID=2527987 RepID=A0A5C5XWP2_9BACT|nr:FG-GAP-like repeat-containing protein [Allorhodopirellula solitaria]TWT66022.1 ASPIC and UnbV [Allorhodopirellula solitaria]
MSVLALPPIQLKFESMFYGQSSPHRRVWVVLLASVLHLAPALMLTGCHQNAAEKQEHAESRGPAKSTGETIATGKDGNPDDSDLLQVAQNHMRRGQADEALQVVTEVLRGQPQNAQALQMSIQIHAGQSQFRKAADLGARLAAIDPGIAPALLASCFDWNLRSGRYDLAETNLLTAIELAPHDIECRRFLVQLYNAQGRRFETRDHVIELIRGKAVTWPEILSLIDLSGPYTLVSYGDLIDESNISLFTLGKMRAAYAGFDMDHDEVIATVQRIVEKCPDSTAASAYYGRLLMENGHDAELMRWFADLPQGIDQQPEYWFTLASWLQQNKRDTEAIRAYGEALRLDSGYREALRALILSLDKTGAEQQAVALRERLAILDQIFRTARDADAEQAMWIASELQKLTRPWESLAWLMHSAETKGNLRQTIAELNQRAAQVSQWADSASPKRIVDARLQKLLGFDLSDWPLPDLDEILNQDIERVASDSMATEASDFQSGHHTSRAALQFDDIASSVGLEIDTKTGFFDQANSFYAHQVNGSGLGVLDYDLDGRPDLYAMQSAGPPNDPQGSHPNQLFRLQPDQSFTDVSVEAQTGDRNYGAGVAVGDINQDGFPDLLLGNVGESVLLVNQGDGTFRNASELIQGNPAVWTSSLAIADVSGDHLPELIQVNYIDDETVFEIQCAGGYLHCRPQGFRAATDRILKGNVDGTFSTWKSIATIADNPKLGLGLVVANFDKQHGNDIFVANDGDLNHYWASAPAEEKSGERFELIELAGLRGCSIGQGGISQACMGIAAGDFNRDGFLDLQVTNFHHEPVNLFIQNRLGFFSDQSTRYGLAAPSMPVLGFGTQTQDYDNDGWLDLATLNGHVYDASDHGVPFRMKSQLFHGSEGGFAMEQPEAAGSYWQQEQLGRALATWDWNRDGRMDLVANHLDQPLAVLENNSAAQNWVQLELIGTASERDAIGAEVTATAGSETWTTYRKAGDGYMASNEAVLHVGIGEVETIDRLEVRWPSGAVQTFVDVSANARYLLIEAEPELYQR